MSLERRLAWRTLAISIGIGLLCWFICYGISWLVYFLTYSKDVQMVVLSFFGGTFAGLWTSQVLHNRYLRDKLYEERFGSPWRTLE